MSLRTKTLLWISLVFVVLLAAQIAGVGYVLDETSRALELKDARRSLARVGNALDDLFVEWAQETRDAARRLGTGARQAAGTPRWPASMDAAAFEEHGWAFAAVADASGKVLVSAEFDVPNRRLRFPEGGMAQAAAASGVLLTVTQAAQGWSLATLDGAPVLLAAARVPDDGRDAGNNGWLVSGRPVRTTDIASVSKILHLDVELHRAFATQAEASARAEEVGQLADRRGRLVPVDESFANLFLTADDAQGRPVMELKATLKRDFHLQAQESFRYLLIAVTLLSVLIAAVVLLVLEKLVLSRLGRLSRDVQSVIKAQGFDARVGAQGTDELGRLARDFNELLGSQQSLHQQVEVEKGKSDRLLMNILPAKIAQRLKEESGTTAERFEEATILFADIVNFTPMSAKVTPEELVGILNDIFSTFDRLADKHGLEKIKTIGDCYMVAGGIPDHRAGHVEAMASMALDMIEAIRALNKGDENGLKVRIGIHTGPAVAGVIGTRKFHYDLWGDTVNIASRMESSGVPDTVHVTEGVYRILRDRFTFTERGQVQLKGRGLVTSYFLTGRIGTDNPADDALAARD